MSAVLSFALILACTSKDDSVRQAPIEQDPSPDVFLLTVDTINSSYLGFRSEKDSTPALDSLYSESVLFSRTLTVRGLTFVAMPSFLSGMYPSTHRVRGDVTEGWKGTVPLLQERFRNEGYQTYGFSSNMCTYIETGMDHSLCTENPGNSTDTLLQLNGDQALVEGLLQALDQRDPEKPVFAWLHLLLPHEDYEKVEPWYSEFHPDLYTGEFLPSDRDELERRALNRLPLNPEERREMDAWYASSLRQTDSLIRWFLDGLRSRGLYEASIIATGADHGEELALRPEQPYFQHGCSVYNEVMGVSWSIRAPSLEPQLVEQWISSTDIAPTLIELAGLRWKGKKADGRSLRPLMAAEEWSAIPVFAERSTRSAMVIAEGYKYLLNPEGGFHACLPYSEAELVYSAPTVGFWNLIQDPQESQNLAGQGIAEEAALRQQLCDWVSQEGWAGGGEQTLVEACR